MTAGSALVALHVPDGFLQPPVTVTCAALGLAIVAATLRRHRAHPGDPAGSSAVSEPLVDGQIPMAGIAAAFIFAAQMVNFPVAAGTSGHLIGGALVAVLLGPRLGSLVMTVVVVVQALLFADGGTPRSASTW